MTGEQRLFDLQAGIERGKRGMALAVQHRGTILETARAYARQHARAYGSVTADDVMKAMAFAGYQPNALGNAAGSLFRGCDWEHTGRWKKSERVSNHGRAIRVWRLKG